MFKFAPLMVAAALVSTETAAVSSYGSNTRFDPMQFAQQ